MLSGIILAANDFDLFKMRNNQLIQSVYVAFVSAMIFDAQRIIEICASLILGIISFATFILNLLNLYCYS
jgi:hypothetical protein